MSAKERGRLFSIRMDGSNSVPFVIKKDKLMFGRSDSCEIRIYVDGIAPEHCIITFNEEGRGFLEPVNKCRLTFLNGKVIERQVSLEHNDVITVVKRSFRFFYPTSSKYFEPHLSIAPSDETQIHEHFDSNMNTIFEKNPKEICGKRVTFGPSLSPEEFDKSMPPASPLRRGSLPDEKCKTNTPCQSEPQNPDMKRNLFNRDLSTKKIVCDAEHLTSKNELPTFTYSELKSRNVECDYQPTESIEDVRQSKPLFSDVLKSHFSKTEGSSTNVRKLRKSSPRLKRSVQIARPIYRSQKQPVHPRVLAVGSTGHANSPETIVICKKSEKFVPTSTSKKISDVQQKNGNLTSSSSPLRKDSKSTECDCKNSDEDAVTQPLPVFHVDYVDSSDSEECVVMNNSKVNENFGTECKKLAASNEKLNVTGCEGDNICVNQRMEDEVQTTTSLFDAAMDGFHIDNCVVDNSLNNFQNNAEALSCFSDLPYNISNECSTSSCMNTVQKLALTISMINAFHMYNRIIDDISSFPFCFPSTSFQTSIKNIQNTGSQQSEEQGDISSLIQFRNIMQKFFSSKVFDEDKECKIRSCRENLNSETSSSVSDKKKKGSKFASKAHIHLKDFDSVTKTSEIQIAHSQHDNAVWIDQMNKTGEIELENGLNDTNKCYKCKMAINLCNCLQNTHNISIENCMELNPSKTSSDHLMISSGENCCYPSSVESVYIDQLPFSCDVTEQETSNMGIKKISGSFEKMNACNKSLKDIAIKHKSVKLNERSLRPRLLRRKQSVCSTEISTESFDKSQSMKSPFKNLRSRNSLILKSKRRKVSLMYGSNILKKRKTIHIRKRNANLHDKASCIAKYPKGYNSNGMDGEEKYEIKNKRKRKLRSDAPEIECKGIFPEVQCNSKEWRENATNYNEQKDCFVKVIDD